MSWTVFQCRVTGPGGLKEATEDSPRPPLFEGGELKGKCFQRILNGFEGVSSLRLRLETGHLTLAGSIPPIYCRLEKSFCVDLLHLMCHMQIGSPQLNGMRVMRVAIFRVPSLGQVNLIDHKILCIEDLCHT